MRFTVALATLTALALSAPAAQPLCNPEDVPGTVTDLGRRYEYGQEFRPTSAVPAFAIEPGGQPPRYLRAQISLRTAPMNAWHLTVRDAAYHVVETLTAADFAGTAARWTPRVYGPTIWLDFHADPASTGPQDVAFLIERYQIMRESKRSYYSQQGPVANFQPLYTGRINGNQFAPEYLRLGDVAGMLMGGSVSDAWACTVVAVAADLVLTNWHCGGPGDRLPSSRYWKDEICPSTVIDMSWDDDDVSQEFRCTSYVANEALDFALLTVEARAGARLRPAPIRLTPPANRKVTLVHHPAADRKQIAINCDVESWTHVVGGVRNFSHRCDTHPGSSGAPIFNGDQELVGLHRAGFDFSTKTCGYVDKINKAIHISDIVAFLRKNHGALAARLTIRP